MIMRLLLISAVFSAALSTAPQALAQAPPTVSAPAAAGEISRLSEAELAALDRYVLAEMRRQGIPGVAVGVYRRGQPVYIKGYGLADLEWQIPVGSDTRMQTGSLGKQFTAAAILRLAEQGKVDIDAPITRYFPETPSAWAGITVANLLSHTSGIGAHDDDALTRPGGAFDSRQDFTEDQLAAGIAALPTVFEPGTQWRYNNTNYVLLGILIHRVTGQPYNDYLHDAFFGPLGMSDTRGLSDTDIIARRASGYEFRRGELRNQTWVSATFNTTADGTLYTTVEDMARWDRALYGDAILNPASRARMWTPFVLTDGKPNASGYGFGWIINTLNGHRRITHNGAWQGFTSTMIRYPDDGLSVMVMANLESGYSRPDLIARVVAGMVEAPLMPSVAPVLPDDPARLERLRRFLKKAAAAEDLEAELVPREGYVFDPAAARRRAAFFPAGWQDAPMTLVRDDTPPEGGGRYRYRIGQPDDSRLLMIEVAASGRVAGYSIGADPDNR